MDGWKNTILNTTSNINYKKLILSRQTRTLKLLRNTVRHKISSISCTFTKWFLKRISRSQGHLTVTVWDTLTGGSIPWRGCFGSLISLNTFCVNDRLNDQGYNASENEMEGYSNVKQRFCIRSMSFESCFLVRPGWQTGHAYSRTERIIEH